MKDVMKSLKFAWSKNWFLVDFEIEFILSWRKQQARVNPMLI
jgi:hypothetical protein